MKRSFFLLLFLTGCSLECVSPSNCREMCYPYAVNQMTDGRYDDTCVCSKDRMQNKDERPLDIKVGDVIHIKK